MAACLISIRKPKIRLDNNIYKLSPIPQKMQDIFIKNTSQLELHAEIIAV
jgi:hypothetical protein